MWLPWGLVVFLLTVSVTLGLWLYRLPKVAAPAVVRLAIPIGDLNRFEMIDGGAIAISPDSSRIVYVGRSGNTTQLFQRRLDELAAVPIAGTEGAATPFFSPDGRWIAFHSGDGLRKIPTGGGSAATICRTAGLTRGGAWAPDDTIYFGLSSGGPLWRVAATGGSPQAATRLLPGEVLHRWPQVMPDGKSVLFTALLRGTTFDSATAFVQRLDTGERTAVFQGGSAARYVNSGHLIFARSEGLFAVRLDLATLRTDGAPVPVVDNVRAALAGFTTGGAEYAVSPGGTLVYAPGGSQSGEASLVWVDRKGTESPAGAARGQFSGVALSPDASKAAVTITDSTISSIWVVDFGRETMSRLTFDDDNSNPIWTPDGTRITYGKLREAPGRENRYQVFWKAADGSGPEQPLTAPDSRIAFPRSWSGDGRFLIGSAPSGLSQLDMQGRRETALSLPIVAVGGQLSWDAKWLAYSPQAQTGEVYVQPFPSLAGRWQVTDGGYGPRWRRDGKEIFYLDRTGQSMMAVSVTASGSSFNMSKPMMLFTGSYLRTVSSWDVSADGQRFLMIKPPSAQAAAISQLNVVLNWFEELKRLVPAQ
jgi:WD40 repeat protein